MADSDNLTVRNDNARDWFFQGAATAFSVAGWVLISAHVGFASLVKQSGFTLAESVFMTAVIWALPAKVVLISAIGSGASLPAAMFAVALSSIRLMPMVVALMAELRSAKTRKWVLYGLSHFVAITSWVIAMDSVRNVPRPMRTAYYAGLGSTLVITNTAVVAIVFLLVDSLPDLVTAALLLLMPLYFLTSLWGAARERAGHIALAIGIVLGPLFHLVIPSIDLLAAGIVGGIAAYFFHRRFDRGDATQ